MRRRVPTRYDTNFIYVIVNELNGRRYVGRTTGEVRDRWALHRTALRGNRHHSALLQDEWNRDGDEAFTIEVIARVRDRGQQEEEALTMRYFHAGIPLYNKVAGAKPFPSRKALGVQVGDILEYTPDQEVIE